jgi:hypothetical protein
VPIECDMGKAQSSGSYWYGDQQSGFLDLRSSNPRLSTKQAMMDFNKGADKPETCERVKQRSPHAEWVAALKG